ncbi:MAG TPA: EthD family reductase [Pseudonocardia sp.]|jgi:uncharacterized protein (TIGR02118 family)
MYHVIISYGPPNDPVAFDEYHRRTHLPLAGRLPGLRRLTGGRCESPDGDEPMACYLVELSFADRASALAALDSPVGRAAAADIVNFASGGATFVYRDDESVIEPRRPRDGVSNVANHPEDRASA